MTLAELQALINATPDGGFCAFTGGTLDVEVNERLFVRRSITIDARQLVVNVHGFVPTVPFVDCDALTDGARVEIRNLTINGPDCAGWDSRTTSSAGAIQWSRAQTRGGRMILRNMKTTGGYYSGVIRSGGGALELFDCELAGWTAGWACWDSHPNPSATATVVRCRFVAPANSKYDSIGGYVHPCVRVDMIDCYHEAWNRFALYMNGNPASVATQTLTNVTAHNCALIQTGNLTTTILMRCAETGAPRNGGSQLWGPVYSVQSQWLGSGMIGFANGGQRMFVGDVIDPAITPGVNTQWAAAGAQASGTLLLDGCDVTMRYNANKGASLLSMTSATQMATTYRSLKYTSTNINNNPVRITNVEGGTIRVVDCQGMPTPIVSLNGVRL